MARSIVSVVAAGVLLVASGAGMRAETAPQVPVAMIGVWAGVAHVFVNWTEQPTIDVTLSIAPSGRVDGSVGDAVLSAARLERNRGIVGRFFNVRTDWVVFGELQGQLILAEGVRRDRVTMPLNWVRDHFEGSFTTSGLKLGGKDDMTFVAGRMRLDRLR